MYTAVGTANQAVPQNFNSAFLIFVEFVVSKSSGIDGLPSTVKVDETGVGCSHDELEKSVVQREMMGVDGKIKSHH